MKLKQLVLLLLFHKLTFAQFYQASKIVNVQRLNIENLQQHTIYSIDKNELVNLITNSSTEYNLVVSFATWCSPCRKALPKLLQFINENNHIISLYLVNIENNNSSELFETKTYLEDLGYIKPTFTISETYGKGTRSRYKKFITDIIGKKNFSNLYLGLFQNILLTKNFKIIYKSTYNDINTVTIDNIKKIINE